MLNYTDLKKGIIIILDGQPYEVIDASFLRMQQRKPVMQTTLKNLMTGKVKQKNFQPSDKVEEAEVEKVSAEFIYCHRGECIFARDGNPSDRISVPDELVGGKGGFMKEGVSVHILYVEHEPISLLLPAKVQLKVKEAPPAVKGNTTQGGTKQVTLETGAKVITPLFIEKGDVVEVNTETGKYARRV